MLDFDSEYVARLRLHMGESIKRERKSMASLEQVDLFSDRTASNISSTFAAS
jgi:hypothetical protein